ncbi:MAG: IS66 family insertion sequence element accessory protein TnpB [Deltaproteobacteria bacterium]|nr:IS66 family insertion sequence element accessory protein TnpB [Deltaproteobacteria bacterium]
MYFVFRNRGNHSLRILHFDGSGICLCTKRFTTARLGRIWPEMVRFQEKSAPQSYDNVRNQQGIP